ncbi:hypothetical protein Scep_010439 [Stephania cephalantha]|uniref:Uncharacterized protein n=1 Tax=Stephania cephalantha TaxID=152367 RepID=A0AAP0JV20_9MAGN
MTGLTPAHVVGLRHLSARAASAAATKSSPTSATSIPVLPGLFGSESARAEAEFGFSFPPDSRRICTLRGLPVSPASSTGAPPPPPASNSGLPRPPHRRRLPPNRLQLPLATDPKATYPNSLSLSLSSGQIWPYSMARSGQEKGRG